MGMLKLGAIVVALLAIVVGLISKLKPELFLKIPEIGFLPYAILGGKFLPPYFDNSPFLGDEFGTWIRDGDVVVATGIKMGTTWMCYCSDAIRRKGSDKVGLPYTDISYTTPWIELSQMPGQTWAQRKELFNTTMLPDGTKLKDYWDNPAFPFRVFKSHFAPIPPKGMQGDPYADCLPVKKFPKVKFIAIMRNPVEVANSAYTFIPKHRDDFRRMWGGFPPLQKDIDETVRNMLPGNPLDAMYFKYIKAWWPFRNEPNVLVMHYHDMVKDIDNTVTKLAKFLGVDLSTEQYAAVKEKCGFAHMKANNHLFDILLPLAVNESGVPAIFKHATFVNKGKSGETGKKKVMSEETAKLWAAAVKSEFKDPKLQHYAEHGGELPQ